MENLKKIADFITQCEDTYQISCLLDIYYAHRKLLEETKPPIENYRKDIIIYKLFKQVMCTCEKEDLLTHNIINPIELSIINEIGAELYATGITEIL